MANIFAGTEPPEWLREIAKPIGPETGRLFGTLLAGLSDAYSTAKQKNAEAEKTGGKQTSFWEEIPQGFHDAAMDLKDPFWRLKVQEGQLGLAQQKISLDAKQNALSNQIKQTGDIDADQKSIADWVAKYPTLEDRIDAPPPTLKSDFGYKAWEGIRTKDSQSALFKGQKSAIDNFKSSLGKLWRDNPKAAASIQRMRPNPDGSPSEQQLSALEDAAAALQPKIDETEAAKLAKLKAETSKAQAATKAEEKYPVPTIETVDGKKWMFYRGFAPKLLSKVSPELQNRVWMLHAQYNDAIKNGDEAAKTKIESELKTVFNDAPASSGLVAPSGNRYIIK